ncbi:MAG: PQQ-dependent sugar dehydrogenase [Bacillota bacterium]
MKKLIAAAVILLFVFGYGVGGETIEVGAVPQDVEDEFIFEPDNVRVEAWVEELQIPWQLVFLPESDRALVTERPGRIRLINDGVLREKPYADIDVAHRGEGGLMGLTHHPEFPTEPYLYIMYTYQADTGTYYNRISRLTDFGDTAGDEKVLLDQIPAGRNHNGGRLKFGPDAKLYATTGDTYQRELAQDLDNLAGKILRLNSDGTIPEDNPYSGSPVYSYGHRNPQGLAWNKRGHLFISDHGPSGEDGLQAKDMIKVIQPGGNYGWPIRIGSFGDGEYRDPLVLWPENSVPPSGAVFYQEELYVATLGSRALINISVNHLENYNYEVDSIERWFAEGNFSGKYGRFRDVVVGPDKNLYLLTSNRDGRGSPLPGDDKIYQLEISSSQ